MIRKAKKTSNLDELEAFSLEEDFPLLLPAS